MKLMDAVRGCKRGGKYFENYTYYAELIKRRDEMLWKVEFYVFGSVIEAASDIEYLLCQNALLESIGNEQR